MRLLSFFNDIERTMLADNPEPDDGVWANTRMVNVHSGLARLTIARGPKGQPPTPRGSILLQAFTLADGTFCLKANLSWSKNEATVSKAVYSKPGINWSKAAEEVAATWMRGAPDAITASELHEMPSLAAGA